MCLKYQIIDLSPKPGKSQRNWFIIRRGLGNGSHIWESLTFQELTTVKDLHLVSFESKNLLQVIRYGRKLFLKVFSSKIPKLHARFFQSSWKCLGKRNHTSNFQFLLFLETGLFSLLKEIKIIMRLRVRR